MSEFLRFGFKKIDELGSDLGLHHVHTKCVPFVGVAIMHRLLDDKGLKDKKYKEGIDISFFKVRKYIYHFFLFKK